MKINKIFIVAITLALLFTCAAISIMSCSKKNDTNTQQSNDLGNIQNSGKIELEQEILEIESPVLDDDIVDIYFSDIFIDEPVDWNVVKEDASNDIDWENHRKASLGLTGKFEPLDYTFKNKKGSDSYITKFELTEIDLMIIGTWNINGADRFALPHISFLPNRKWILYSPPECFVIGKWKITDEILYVTFDNKIDIIDKSINETNFENYREIEPDNWVKLYEIEHYTSNFSNQNKFELNNISSEIQELFKLHDINKETPRYRSITTYSSHAPSPYDLMYKETSLGKLLLNGNLSSKNDIISLWKYFILV